MSAQQQQFESVMSVIDKSLTTINSVSRTDVLEEVSEPSSDLVLGGALQSPSSQSQPVQTPSAVYNATLGQITSQLLKEQKRSADLQQQNEDLRLLLERSKLDAKSSVVSTLPDDTGGSSKAALSANHRQARANQRKTQRSIANALRDIQDQLLVAEERHQRRDDPRSEESLTVLKASELDPLINDCMASAKTAIQAHSRALQRASDTDAKQSGERKEVVNLKVINNQLMDRNHELSLALEAARTDYMKLVNELDEAKRMQTEQQYKDGDAERVNMMLHGEMQRIAEVNSRLTVERDTVLQQLRGTQSDLERCQRESAEWANKYATLEEYCRQLSQFGGR